MKNDPIKNRRLQSAKQNEHKHKHEQSKQLLPLNTNQKPLNQCSYHSYHRNHEQTQKPPTATTLQPLLMSSATPTRRPTLPPRTSLTRISHVVSPVKNIWNWNIFTYEIFISHMEVEPQMKYYFHLWNFIRNFCKGPTTNELQTPHTTAATKTIEQHKQTIQMNIFLIAVWHNLQENILKRLRLGEQTGELGGEPVPASFDVAWTPIICVKPLRRIEINT